MKKSLAMTNPYLNKKPEKRDELVRRAATSSTAVEGVHIKHYKESLRKYARPKKASSKF